MNSAAGHHHAWQEHRVEGWHCRGREAVGLGASRPSQDEDFAGQDRKMRTLNGSQGCTRLLISCSRFKPIEIPTSRGSTILQPYPGDWLHIVFSGQGLEHCTLQVPHDHAFKQVDNHDITCAYIVCMHMHNGVRAHYMAPYTTTA